MELQLPGVSGLIDLCFSQAVVGAAKTSEAVPNTELVQLDTTEDQASGAEHQPLGEIDAPTTTPTASTVPLAPAVAPGSPRVSRKRPIELSQLDLFGSMVTSPPRQRSRSLSLPRIPLLPSFGAETRHIVIGDDNLAGMTHEDTEVFALPNGRLYNIRNLLRACKGSFPSVKKFVLVLSHLDRTNALSTNSATVRHVLSAARRLFPKADYAIACDGECECENESVRQAVRLFTKDINETPPRSCSILPAPEHFMCVKGKWSSDTKGHFFSIILHFLE